MSDIASFTPFVTFRIAKTGEFTMEFHIDDEMPHTATELVTVIGAMRAIQLMMDDYCCTVLTTFAQKRAELENGMKGMVN